MMPAPAPWRRRAAGLIAAVLALGAGVCDPGDITIVPEVEGLFSFEGGLDGWRAAASTGSTTTTGWSVTSMPGVSVVGSSSARFSLEDATASEAVWIERAFVLTPEEAYRVDLTVQVGEEGPTTGSWGGVLEISDRPLSDRAATPAAVDDLGGGASAGFNWAPWSRSVSYDTAVDQDTVWVAVGVKARSPEARSYYFDGLELVFTRR